MKLLRSVVPAAVGAVVALHLGATISADTVEKILAKVNGQIVTMTEIDEELDLQLERLGPAPNPEDDQRRREELRKQILDRVIDNLLVMQVAEERGLRVPARFFDEWKANVMKEMKIEDEEEFVRQIAIQGLSVEDLKEQFETGILVQEVRRTEVDNKVAVSEPEIEKRYRERIQDYTEPEKIRLREIVVRYEEGSQAEARSKAERLLQDLQQGADFAEVARLHSESDSAEAGGDLGFFEKGELTESLAEAAFALNPGDVSDIVDLGAAFYVLLAEEKTEEKTKPLDEIRNEIAESIYNEKMTQEMEKYILRLRERAIIEVLL